MYVHKRLRFETRKLRTCRGQRVELQVGVTPRNARKNFVKAAESDTAKHQARRHLCGTDAAAAHTVRGRLGGSSRNHESMARARHAVGVRRVCSVPGG